MHIKITHASAKDVHYDGVFACTFDAICDALDRGEKLFGPDACIGVDVTEVRQ